MRRKVPHGDDLSFRVGILDLERDVGINIAIKV
jgi:hypothetical protein